MSVYGSLERLVRIQNLFKTWYEQVLIGLILYTHKHTQKENLEILFNSLLNLSNHYASAVQDDAISIKAKYHMYI